MTAAFIKRERGGVRLTLTRAEAAVLRSLFEQLLELLGGPRPESPAHGLPDLAFSESTSAPEDPVLARLFPDGYRDDGVAAAEFRRYTEAGLRDGKRDAAQVVLRTVGEGGDVELDAEEAGIWLRALNDIRLALGTRLEITEESLEQARSLNWRDPRYAPYAAYEWLTGLQEDLVHALW